MPKRTNDFQTLIAHIYRQIVAEGGEVTESAMVYDKDAGILREVDILVKHKYAGHNFSFIVECRDRSRADTVEWIDGLIGKAKSINVDKVIAVSSKGFAKSAIRKANENGIEAYTLEEANEAHWNEFPFKPGMLLMSAGTYSIKELLYKNGENLIPMSKLNIETEVEQNGEKVGNIKSLVQSFFETFIVPQIEQYIKDNFLNIFKTKEDAFKTLMVKSSYLWPEVTAIDLNGNTVKFSELFFIIWGTFKTADVNYEHKVFNKKTVSIGSYTGADGYHFESKIIQDPDTQKIHITWEQFKSA